MTTQEHERAELYEDCNDLAKRLHGAANRIEKIGDINGAIMKRMDLENIRIREDLRRLRVAHLRRMACFAVASADFTRPITQRNRLYRFADNCGKEIARLRGEE